jgi:glycosyltransferase involved in cell wall biosynthesis
MVMGRFPRLLFVTPFYKPAYVYGGPVRSIPALCEALVVLNTDVTVYTTNANGKNNLNLETAKLHEVDGVHVRYFERKGYGSYFFSSQLAQACNDTVTEFDLIYVSSTWAYPFISVCRAAILNSIPFIVGARGSFVRWSWKGKYLKKMVYHRLVERSFLNQANAIHYTTLIEKRESEWLGLKSPSFVMSNPVNLKEFELSSPSGVFRKTYNLDENAKLLLFLGRVEAEKGIDLALQALSHISAEFPEVKLVLAGPEEDGYFSTIRNRSLSLGISDHVIITGLLNSRQRLEAIADADVFILTSHSDNFGMAVVEAMAGGLPVLISDRVGIADDVRDGGAGIIVPLDSKAIAEGMASLLSSEAQRRHMGLLGKGVAEKYAPCHVAERMLAQFENINLSKKVSLR